ncbi:hypothetical protein ACOSP7_016726 [Xanthoceras sorbifolium]
MGFPCVLNISNCMSIKVVLSYFKFLLMMALTHVGLPKPPQEQVDSADEINPTSHVLILDGPTPSIVTIPVQELISLIKKKLPVVEYINFLERFNGELEDSNYNNSNSICNVCLDSIEKRHEIRELSNCCHVFHKQCLDCWVDVGQITCPLCRSMLLPLKGDRLQLQEVLA